MKMFFIAVLAIANTAAAQLKIPGRKAIEKKVEKTANSVLNGSDKKDNGSSAPDTNIPAEETNSPAKSYINSFWKHIEKMKNHDNENNKQIVYNNGINAAKTALNNTK